jgi:hypothetical protein
MKLGIYTIATQALFVGAKLLGLADNVGWGFILAPAFFHAGGFTVLFLQMRMQQKALEKFNDPEFIAELEQALTEAMDETVQEMKDERDDTIH